MLWLEFYKAQASCLHSNYRSGSYLIDSNPKITIQRSIYLKSLQCLVLDPLVAVLQPTNHLLLNEDHFHLITMRNANTLYLPTCGA